MSDMYRILLPKGLTERRYLKHIVPKLKSLKIKSWHGGGNPYLEYIPSGFLANQCYLAVMDSKITWGDELQGKDMDYEFEKITSFNLVEASPSRKQLEDFMQKIENDPELLQSLYNLSNK